MGVTLHGNSEPKYGKEGSIQVLGVGTGVEEPIESEESITQRANLSRLSEPKEDEDIHSGGNPLYYIRGQVK